MTVEATVTTPPEYVFGTKPYDHQLEAFNLSKDKDLFALLMEQGTGKTKVAIDTAGYNYAVGRINALLVVAPNGVHRNWITDEVPEHLPDYIDRKTFFWQSSKASRKWFKNDFEKFMRGESCFRVFAINIDAVTTKAGRAAVERFLLEFEAIMVVDESQKIKTHNTNRTKACIKLGIQAKLKRILTGTPIINNPLDLFGQMMFLDKSILGHSSYYGFRNEYAILETGYNYNTDREYKQVVGYQNQERLHEILSSVSYRKTKDECLDLPPKIFEKVYVELSREQQKHYTALSEELVTELYGETISAQIVLTKLLRLQQVIGGFLPAADGKPLRIEQKPPKLATCLELLEDHEGKAIIWSRFTSEIDLLVHEIGEKFGHDSVVRYDGGVDDDERAAAKKAFQDPDSPVRFFVAQQEAGGTGLTLHQANLVIYYSNTYSYGDRLQTEDRAHRIGQEKPVVYFDLVAPDTVDDKIIGALRTKRDVADVITGDDPKAWI